MPYRIGSNGPYTHYIDPDHPNATNTDNPHGTQDTPRIDFGPFIQTLAAGSVIEVHGRWYSQFWISEGTPEKPIFIRGTDAERALSKSVGGQGIESSYMVFENIDFDMDGNTTERFRFDRKSENYLPDIHDIVIRNCSFFNGLQVPTSPYQIIRGKTTKPNKQIYNIVVWNNYFYECGVNRSIAVTADVVAVSADVNCRHWWVVDNSFERVAGDGIQIAADGFIDETTSLPHHIYFAGNKCRDAYENIVDLKQCRDIVIAHNEVWHIGEGYGDIGGETAIPYRYSTGDVGVSGSRTNIWSIDNSVHDSNIANGAFVCASQEGDSWHIGNLVYDCGGSGIGIFVSHNGDAYILNNTVRDAHIGIYSFGRQTYVSGQLRTVANNIVDRSWMPLWIAGVSGVTPSGFSDQMNIHNNLFFSGRYRTYTYPTPVDINEYPDSSGFAAAYPDFFDATSLDIDPLLLRDGEGGLEQNSPAKLRDSRAALQEAADEFKRQFPTAEGFKSSSKIGSIEGANHS